MPPESPQGFRHRPCPPVGPAFSELAMPHGKSDRSPAPLLCRLSVGRALGTVVVTLHGAFDRSASPYLATVLDDLIDGQGNLAVVLDLRDVGRIDCSGVEAVAVAVRRIARRGGELALAGAVPAVRHVLVANGLTRLIVGPEERQAERRSPSSSTAASPAPAPVSLHPAGSNCHNEEPTTPHDPTRENGDNP